MLQLSNSVDSGSRQQGHVRSPSMVLRESIAFYMHQSYHAAAECYSMTPDSCVSCSFEKHADKPLMTICSACRGYVRYFGLSANQPVHIQGCGDFNIDAIESAEDPCSSGRKSTANGVQGMDMAGEIATVLATADPAKRQGVGRLNTPDPLAGEQTWPTEQVGSLC